MKKTFFVLAISQIIITSLCFTACNTDDANGMGTFSVRVGSGASRGTWNNYNTDQFIYEITLSNGPGVDQNITIYPDTEIGTAHFTVEPGNWTIAVEASLKDEDVVAVGSETVNIKAGKNGAITIKMRSPEGGDGYDLDNGGIYDFTVTSADEWNAALQAIKESASGDITIGIKNNITVAGSTYKSFDTSQCSITIYGNSKTITMSGTGSLLYIDGDGQTVTLEKVNLQGNNSNDDSLVYISTSGKLIMNSGTISGNTISSGNGGGAGVSVSGATFIMNGGTISGNNATSGNGGGVFVAGNATFIMNGGTISGNNATSGNGGGVNVNGVNNSRGEFNMTSGEIKNNSAYSGGGVSVNLGDFKMSGGTIYGTDNADNGNTATNYASLFLDSNVTATYGLAPNGTGGGNLTSNNNTIKVVNGEKP